MMEDSVIANWKKSLMKGITSYEEAFSLIDQNPSTEMFSYEFMMLYQLGWLKDICKQIIKEEDDDNFLSTFPKLSQLELERLKGFRRFYHELHRNPFLMSYLCF